MRDRSSGGGRMRDPGQLIATRFRPKKCKGCGKTYRPKASNQRYCPTCQSKRPKSQRPVNF